MMRFIDQKLAVGKPTEEIIKIKVDSQENQLPLENIVTGARTERFPQKQSQHGSRCKSAVMMTFYVTVISYLQRKLPVTDKVLISFGFLHPSSGKKQKSCCHIQYLSGVFPHVITEIKGPNVRNECVFYLSDDKVNIFEGQSLGDHCWHSVFFLESLVGKKKYPLLEKLVRSILLLYHDNSAVERLLVNNIRDIICWKVLSLVFDKCKNMLGKKVELKMLLFQKEL